jgi:hypothetical protein
LIDWPPLHRVNITIRLDSILTSWAGVTFSRVVIRHNPQSSILRVVARLVEGASARYR